MSVVFEDNKPKVIVEGMDEPKACYTVEGNAIDPAIMYCAFYNMCKQRQKDKADYRPSDCPVKRVSKDIEDLLANRPKAFVAERVTDDNKK